MNPQRETLFNFHGFVSLRVIAPPRITAFLRSEWGPFVTSQNESQSDISVRWMERTELDKFRRREEGEQAAGWYKGCFWKASIGNDDGQISVHYWSLPRSGFLFKDSCLEPLVLEQLASKGMHGLHASSLRIGNRAWLFCGPPGTGKTVLGLLGVKEGHALLSDDIALLGAGKVFPYPLPPRLSPKENLGAHLLLQLISGRVSTDFLVKSVINYATMGWLHIPVRILSPNYASSNSINGERYPLGGIFFLKTGRGSVGIRIGQDLQEIVREAVSRAPSHGASILNHLSVRDSSESDRQRYLRKELETLVEERRCFELHAHPRMSTDDWKQVFHDVSRTVMECG